MEQAKTHYPSYDVMAMVDEWDSHTKEIVKKRLGPFSELKFLNNHEKEMLYVLSEHITYDNRKEIFDWIIHHIDQRLSEEIGESQRKPEVPAEKYLIRDGLGAIDKMALADTGKLFVRTDTKDQFTILANLQKGKAQVQGWDADLQKELFKKLTDFIIGAYYSHPRVWSEIGYGGPAYPRGYYRVEFGVTDPWEPKLEGSKGYGFGEGADIRGE